MGGGSSRQQEIFPLPYIIQPNCEKYTCPIQTEPGSFPGAKEPHPETYHTRPSRTEVKNSWSFTCSPSPVSLA